jgi:hypothetical protein
VGCSPLEDACEQVIKVTETTGTEAVKGHRRAWRSWSDPTPSGRAVCIELATSPYAPRSAETSDLELAVIRRRSQDGLGLERRQARMLGAEEG